MPEQKIILSVVGQVLVGINDEQLLKFIKMVTSELDDIITEFDPVEEELRQVLSENGQFSDMARNQNGTE